MKIFGVSVKKIPFYDDTHERMLRLNSRAWKETFRTCAVLSVLLCSVCLDTGIQYMADAFFTQQVLFNEERSKKFASRPVFDVFLWMFLPFEPRWRIPKWFCDSSILALMLLVFVMTVLKNPNQPFQGLTTLRRFCFIQSIAYIVHFCTIPFTLIPALNEECYARQLPSSQLETFWMFVKLAAGQSLPCIDNSFSVTVTLTANLAFFLLAYCGNFWIKWWGLVHAGLTLLALSLCHYHYSISISLGLVASVFTFGTYHLLLLVFCQSKIFLGVTDDASMGFNLFFLNGMFCRNATKCIEWVDGLDLREMQPFVADLETETNERDVSLLKSAKLSMP